LIQYELSGWKDYKVEISQEDFEELKRARRYLFEALFMEEKLNLVLENYAEFEQELFKCAVNNLLFEIDDWSSRIDELHTVNRRIINLLTTCRLYIDQVSHNISSIYGSKSEQKKAFEKQTNQEYDSDRPGYRVMGAMRNYVQHCALPLNGLTYGRPLIETDSKQLRKRIIKLSIDTNKLSEDKEFKSSILAELQSLGESVELTPLIRQYLESIGRIHMKIRGILAPDLQRWEEIIQRPVRQYHEATGHKAGLIASSGDDSKLTEAVSIFGDVIDRRRMLESKNKFLTHYSSNFISSEAPEINVE